MSHFAKIENGIVTQVIVAEQDFIDSLDDSSEWIQTSYNTHGGKHYLPDSLVQDDKQPLRKNFAGVGFTYDPIRDAFIAPQPYPSWLLNENTCFWEAPIPYPTDGEIYKWNEDTINWILQENN